MNTKGTIYFYRYRKKLWSIIVRTLKPTLFYNFLYRSFWHSKFKKSDVALNANNYFTAIPNPGAGIGHQMANWIAGYWFSKQFGLKFAHTPFSNKNWEEFLGFGDNEIIAEVLVKTKGFKKVRLPLFNEHSESDLSLIKQIIASYNNQKIVFLAEQDQYYEDQYGVIEAIKEKFYKANSKKNDQLIFDNDNYNVAVHVRRGDIVIGQENLNPNLLMRWLDNDYFENVLREFLPTIKTDKKIVIYLFSQGKESDFESFKDFDNLKFCLDMNAQESFLHMVFADALITSKSSFSYKPALLNNGIKVCPENFWHKYPNTSDWIMVDDNGFLK